MGNPSVIPNPQLLLPSSTGGPYSGVSDEDMTDLLKDDEGAQNAAKALCKHFIGLDKWVRRQEVIDTRRQRFYWRGDQYIYWKSDSVGFIPAIAGQAIANTDNVAPRYTDVYNIFTPYGESLLATLISNPPGVNWQAVDPSNINDTLAAKTAEKYQQKIEADNDRKTLQSDVARLFYTDGRTVLYCRRDEKRQIERITAHGVLETKVVPVTANSIDDLVALIISDEIDIYQAKGDYPDYAKGIKSNTSTLGESAYERIARLGVLQGTRLLMQAGDAFSHMVTRHVFFLRTCTFEKLPDKYRDQFQETFPDGLKITWCGDQYCGSENVKMEDQATVEFPGPGDGMSRPSIGKRMVPLQDVFNDELNLWHEAHDYCVPTLFMYSETGDIEAVREQISEPGNIVPFTSLPPGASSAEAAFYAAVLEGIPATLPQFIQFIQGPLGQFISGAFPALFGGDTGDNDTAKGIAIQRDQAMGRMGLSWSSLQRLFAGAYTNAVKLAAKYASPDQNFMYQSKDQTGKTVVEKLSLEDLSDGSAVCRADTDSSFPESTTAKRATYMTLMTAAERNPVLAKVMSDPNNLEYGHAVLGLSDLVIPGADSRNKQLVEIQQLLAEIPVMPDPQTIMQFAMQNPQFKSAMEQWNLSAQQAKLKGMTPPSPPIPPELMQSSIAIDPEFDNNVEEYQTVQDWLNGEDRRKEDAKGNQRGVLNVRLHGLMHKKAIPPPPEPMPTGKKGTTAAGPTLANAAAA